MEKAALVTGYSRSQNIHAALSLIKEDVEASITGKRRVLIKPNLTALDNIHANTSVEAAEAVIEFINGLGKREIIIGEGSGSAYYAGRSTLGVFRHFGYEKLLEKYPNVKLVNLDAVKEYVNVKVETIHGRSEVRVVKPFWDYTVSLAIPKTHDYAIATLSLKNMMGLVASEDRLKIHGIVGSEEIAGIGAGLIPKKILRLAYLLPRRMVDLAKNKKTYRRCVVLIHRNLLSLFREVMPNLAVIDGYYGMEGDGPTDGKGIKHGIAIASLDPVRADAIAASCMGFQPEKIGYLHYCAREGIGSISTGSILGTSPHEVRIRYRPHRYYKYQKSWKPPEGFEPSIC